jgi:hypothetical protein
MSDELQLVRDFKSDIIEPDQKTASRSFARVTQQRAVRRLSGVRAGGYRPAVAALALVGAAAAIGVISLSAHGGRAGVGSNSSPTLSTSTKGGSQNSGEGLQGLGPEVTLARPLGLNGSEMSLADAANELGAAVTLPDSTTVRASDAGPVWAASANDGEVSVAVTFPQQGLIVQYQRPAMSDPLSHFQSVVKDSPGSEVVYLNGNVPALSIPLLPDGSNWGSIEFVVGGTVIVIMGHNDESTLEGVANSILDQSSSN